MLHVGAKCIDKVNASLVVYYRWMVLLKRRLFTVSSRHFKASPGFSAWNGFSKLACGSTQTTNISVYISCRVPSQPLDFTWWRSQRFVKVHTYKYRTSMGSKSITQRVRYDLVSSIGGLRGKCFLMQGGNFELQYCVWPLGKIGSKTEHSHCVLFLDAFTLFGQKTKHRRSLTCVGILLVRRKVTQFSPKVGTHCTAVPSTAPLTN